MKFTSALTGARVLFGQGVLQTGLQTELERRQAKRVVGITTPGNREKEAREYLQCLGEKLVGLFALAAQHTTVESITAAKAVVLEAKADCIVTFGGGSPIGVGKALMYEENLKHLFFIAVVTTYSGSEMTQTFGLVQNGRKTTIKAERCRPAVVIYDSELTPNLPVQTSISSSFNALAHSVEALWAKDTDPLCHLVAEEGIRTVVTALPGLIDRPQDLSVRDSLLYGAYLCGVALNNSHHGIHHKACHVLGGSFGLPHAEVHTVILPHAIHYNTSAAPEALQKIARAVGVGHVEDVASFFYDFQKSLGAPTNLKALGSGKFGLEDIDKAVEILGEQQFQNPRAFDREAVRHLFLDAFHGNRPGTTEKMSKKKKNMTEDELTRIVCKRFEDDMKTKDPRLKQLLVAVVKHVHAFVKDVRLTNEEWEYGIKFLTETGKKCSDIRQEFILLSDTLGVSMLLDLVTYYEKLKSSADHVLLDHVSESTVLGPFFTAGVPELPLGSSIVKRDDGGDFTLIYGTIINAATNKPVSNAVIDVWQTSATGFYDSQDPSQPQFNMRGKFRTNESGLYYFLTVRPISYPIPHDGPVGEMLKAAGRHPYRPAHIHFIISADGFHPLTTHLFDEQDPYLQSDAVFAVKESLVVSFEKQTEDHQGEELIHLGLSSDCIQKLVAAKPHFVVHNDFFVAPQQQ